MIEKTSCSLFHFLPFTFPNSFTPKIWKTFKEAIGGTIRDSFFLPLNGKLSLENRLKVQGTIDFFEDFWNLLSPLNPQLPYQKEIRETFVCKKEAQTIEVAGKSLKVEYNVIESPSSSSASQNLVCILGNSSLLNNNISYIYPFLASYLEKNKHSIFPIPLRMICISQYATFENNHLYKPKTLEEAGMILTEVLKKIAKTKGPIDQVVAHSLGTIVLASSLKYAAHEKGLIPSNILFDRGPSSIEETSYRKLGNLGGWVALKLAKLSGWDLDLGLEIQKHLGSRVESNILISEVIHDFHFENIGISSSPQLKNVPFKKFIFDFADSFHIWRSHHSLSPSLLDGHHLVPRNPSLLENNESLASKVIDLMSKPETLTELFSRIFSKLNLEKF